MSLESIDMGNPNQDYKSPDPVIQETYAMLSKFAKDANKNGGGMGGLQKAMEGDAPKATGSKFNTDPVAALSGQRGGSKQDIAARRMDPTNNIDNMGMKRGYWAQKDYARQTMKAMAKPHKQAFGFGAKSGMDLMGNKLPNKKPVVISPETILNSGMNSGPIGYIKAQRDIAQQQKRIPTTGALLKGALENKEDAKLALDNMANPQQVQDFMEGKPEHVQRKVADLFGANRVQGDKLSPPTPGKSMH